MPDEFRFLVICNDISGEPNATSLHHVVDTVTLESGSLPTDLKLKAVVGAVIRDPMWGKPLDLMAWQLGNNGQRETLVKYRGTPLILPEMRGAITLPYDVTVPIWTPGIYGFDLFDREGAFGEKDRLLATFLYAVSE